MAKQVLQVTNFAGGLNAYSDARDIQDNQFTQNWNAEVDRNGIIRVSGMAGDSILTEYFSNTNFQPGHGLFQFSSDYSLSEVSGSFSVGIKTGIFSNVGNNVTMSLEATATASPNEFQNMMIYIIEGTAAGQSRVIDSNTNATPPVLTIKDAFNPVPDTTSKYVIFPWKTDNANWVGKDGGNDGTNHDKDFITNGFAGYTAESELKSNYTTDYYIFSKKTSITDETSADLGYVEYGKALTLTPGTEYCLSFDCAHLSTYNSLVSKGDVDPIDGGTSHADKVPWVQLYSEDVADTKGSLKKLDAYQVTVSDGGVSAEWTDAKTYKGVQANSTEKGNGQGATFNIVTSASGNTVTFHIVDRGENYVVDEELIFENPDWDGTGSVQTAKIVIESINVTGLSLTASSTPGGELEWSSGIMGNGATSKYLSYANHNYIANGDFTNGTTSWTSGSKITAAEATDDGSRYDKHDGTLNLSKSSFQAIHLTSPWDNSWSEYIHQDVVLDENTTYHLNFLYDVYSGQSGINLAVYDTTNSVPLILPVVGYRGETRPGFNPDGSASLVNFRYGGTATNGHDISNLKDMHYTTFSTGNSPTSSTSNTCTVRIGFAPTLAHGNIRLTSVSLHKAHNDLVTMGYKSDSQNKNPFAIKNLAFYNYTLKFKIPQNYSKDDNWKLRLYGGEYSFRTDNDYTQLNVEGGNNYQEIYFDNIKLISSGSDVLTLLTDNTANYSDIFIHSKNSNSWFNNMIRWNQTSCKPNYDYINGMLKISDANFNNDNNSNKLMYYAGKEDTYGSGKVGWNVIDKALQEPPSVSFESVNTENIISQFTDCVPLLNSRYTPDVNGITTFLQGNYNGTESNNSNPRNNNSVAAAYGPNHIQGFVTRYWFDRRMEIERDTIYNDSFGGHQIMIPRFTPNFVSNQPSDWYLDNVQTGSQSYLGGGYNFNSSINDLSTTQTGGIHSTELNYPAFSIKSTSEPTSFLQNTEYKEIGIPSDILKNLKNSGIDDAGDVAKVEIEFEYQIVGSCVAEGNDSILKLDLTKVDCSDETIDDININWNPSVFSVDSNMNTTRNYGRGDTNTFNDNYGYESYNSNEDDGECLSLIAENYSDTGVFKVIISDSIHIPKGELTTDEKFVLKLSDFLGYATSRMLFNTNNEAAQSGGDPKFYATSSAGGFDYPQDKYRTGPSTVATFSRFLINKLKIYHYNDAAFDDTVSNFYSSGASQTQSTVLFQWGKPKGESSLSWGERTFTLAVSSTNIFNEESSINELNDTIGGIGLPSEEFPDGVPVIEIGYAPTISIRLKESHFHNPYITKTKFYMKDENSEIYYLQFYIDHKTGKMHSTTSGVQASKAYSESSYSYDWILERENFLNFNEVNSYESETFVNQEDAKQLSNLTCRYKTSVVANNRLYVGNIMQNGRKYGDRMLKSPIGKYNVLPKSNFIDVAINDGDEITALAYYKDKILQYKKRKVFIINVSGDFEFLEDTFENVGVLGQHSVTKTPYGIAWANKTGCYIYDGSKMYNLIDNVIPAISDYAAITNNYWLVSAGSGDAVIGYIQDTDTLLIKFTAEKKTASVALPEAITYHFPTKSWTFNVKGISGNANDGNVGEISNMITNQDGDVLYYRNNPDVLNDADDSIKKWNNAATINTDNPSLTKPYQFSTKDFTFGNITDRKKLYKVYITYKVKTDGTDSGVSVKGAINGSGDFTEIAFSTSSTFTKSRTACYTSSTLNETDGNWKIAELKFENPAAVNNIYSFQLNLSAANVAVDFEVNDISIVFKTKRTK